MDTRRINIRRVIWSGLVNTVIGAILGIGFAQVAALPHASEPFQKLRRSYPIIGAVGGFVCGVGIGVVFLCDQQIKQEERMVEENDNDPT